MQTRRTDLPHVTDILRGAGLVDARWFTPIARDRGSALHLATELLDQRDLLRSTVDPSIAGAVAAYERFLAEMAPKILETEKAVEHDILRYCGTFDRLVELDSREGVLDLKKGSEEPWHGIQLIAYARCLKRPLARWNLYLKDDGTYRLRPRTGLADWTVFKAALTLYSWRKQQ